MPDWGVLVLESHHAPDFSMEWRTHPFVKVIYALSGRGRVLIRDQEYVFAPNDVIVVPPRHKNRIIDDADDPSSLYVFCLSSNLLGFDRDWKSQIVAGPLRRSPQFSARVQRHLRRLLFEQTRRRPATPITMVGDAIQLLGVLIQQPSYSASATDIDLHDDEMETYVEHLRTHFFEATTIDDAASQLGMSRRQFTQRFRQVTGETWLAFVRRLCIGHAQRLLRDTTIPITSVAFECGFDDLSTFYRQFKRQTGVAPGIWREQTSSE